MDESPKNHQVFNTGQLTCELLGSYSKHIDTCQKNVYVFGLCYVELVLQFSVCVCMTFAVDKNG